MSTRLSLGPDAVADAEEFIHTMIAWGEHHCDRTRGWSAEQMRAEIPDYEQVLDSVRQGYPVKYFENLLGASWHTAASSRDAPGVGVRNPASTRRINFMSPGNE